MNPNVLRALLVTSLGVGPLAREALDPITPLLFIAPSDPSLPVFFAPLEELAARRAEDPELRVLHFGAHRKSMAPKHARELELERQAARDVEANPDPQDGAWGSWMIRCRLQREEGAGAAPRVIVEILPLLDAAEAISTQGDERWAVFFRRHVPRKNARILARCFELGAVELGVEAEATHQAVEPAAAAEPTP